MLTKHKDYEETLKNNKNNLSLIKEENAMLVDKLIAIKDKNRKLHDNIDKIKIEY